MAKKNQMTERKWLASADPMSMLNFLTGKASERKLRLFACACCRRIWNLIAEQSAQSAVEIAERYADGKATKKAAEQAGSAIDGAYSSVDAAVFSAVSLEGRPAYGAAIAARGAVVAGQEHTEWGDDDQAPASEFQAQADYLRDIFGPLPFRSLTIEPEALTSTVTALARGIYEQRAFERLPILADALEDAGCPETAILEHLRGPGPHVRGCWPVDLLLGKQ